MAESGLVTATWNRGTFDLDSPAFDWGADYQKPNIPFQDLIVYEVAVRGFTAHESSKLGPLSGSYLGLASKVRGDASCRWLGKRVRELAWALECVAPYMDP